MQEFKYIDKLTANNEEEILLLHQSIKNVSIEQFPLFARAFYFNEKVIHGLMYYNSILVGYAQLRIKKSLLAQCYFGPIVNEPRFYPPFIEDIICYLKKTKIYLFKVIPPVNIDTSVNLEKHKYFFNKKDSRWSTQIININKPLNEILATFSDNHKRAIKKAIKINLTTQILNKSLIKEFSAQYFQMYKSRGLMADNYDIETKFENLFNFFEINKNGFFIGVFQQEQLIGGLCITCFHDTAFYLAGYAHPNHRKLPINHLAFYNAIEYSQSKQIENFDLGGYALNTINEQLININKFKNGFNGNIVNNPNTLYFVNSLFLKKIVAIPFITNKIFK